MAFDAFDEGEGEDEASAREARRVKRMANREALHMAFIEKEVELDTVQENRATFHQYSPMFMLSGLKDVLDWTGIGSLPGIGWVVTICFSVGIFLMLQLSRTNKHLGDSRFILRRVVILLIGTLVEAFVVGVNFLPFETITVLLIFLMDRFMSDKQIERVTEILQMLHRERKVRT